MAQTHQGQSFNFQLLAAIYYMIEENLDRFAVEGPNYEDSVFERKNKIVAIGEAKYLKSKKNWTSDSLFFHNEKGPLTQLWERDRNVETLILFSHSSLSKEIKYYDGIKIPEEDLKQLLQKMKEIPNIKRKEELSLKNLSKFIEKIRFIKTTINKLEELIIESLRAQDIRSNDKKLRSFAGHISSDNYTSGTFISRESLLRRLRINTSENYSLQVSFRPDVVEINKIMNTTIDFVPMQKEEVRPKNFIESFIFDIPDSYYDRKIREYNEKMPEYLKFKELDFYLLNTGEFSCDIIDIELETKLNKEFQIKEAVNLMEPKKPALSHEPDSKTESLIKGINQGYNISRELALKNEDSPFYKEDIGEKNKYRMKFKVENIRPSEDIKLKPLYKIYLPENPSDRQIVFNCKIFQSHSSIEPQRLTILLN